MKITIHQPGYLPWLPFLEKALRSDIFVLLDTVQFEKNSEQNRNRIKSPQGELWLTVPVHRHLHTLIPDVVIPPTQNKWADKHKKSIEINYRKTPYFNNVAPKLFDLLTKPWKRLLDLNIAIDRYFLKLAGFEGKFIKASELDVEGIKSDLVLEICKKLGADTYFSGPAGFSYMKLDTFENQNIKVLFQNYSHLEYNQLYPKQGFIPRLSALDFFMNVGTYSVAKKWILKCGNWLTKEEMELHT